MKTICLDKDESGGRCRGLALENSFWCEDHAESRGIAPRPNEIFVKFEVREELLEAAIAAGVRMVERTVERQMAIDDAARREAESAGRKYNEYRGAEKRGDSGAEVFKGGLRDISAAGLVEELLKADFNLVDVHLLRRPGDLEEDKGFVVMVFRKGGESCPLTTEIINCVSNTAGGVWTNCRIFENPPRGKLVRHTANFLGGFSRREPEKYLLLGEHEHWRVVP